MLIGIVTFTVASCVSGEESSYIEGHFERFISDSLDPNSAHLDISKREDGSYHVSGIATWVGNAATGNVNTGEIIGIFQLEGKSIRYDLDGCHFLITFSDKSLLVTEASRNCGGLNVSFNGYYKEKEELP